MKTRRSIFGVLLTALLLTGIVLAQGDGMDTEHMDQPSMPQRGMKNPGPKLPDLTEEQEEQIQSLRTDHLKAMLPLKNELNEMKARLRTLSTADNVDMNEINTLIDEMGEIKIRMMKSGAANRQKIRMLLTDEQRVVFDSRRPRPGRRPPRRR